MTISAIPRPRGLRPYVPAGGRPAPRWAARLAAFVITLVGVLGLGATLGALWVWWDIVPFMAWDRGDVVLFGAWLASIGALSLTGWAVHAWSRRRRGRRFTLALAATAAALLLAMLPVTVAPRGFWRTLVTPPRARLPFPGVSTGPDPAIVALCLLAVCSALLLAGVGLLVAVAGRRLARTPAADVLPVRTQRVRWALFGGVGLAVLGGLVTCAASAPGLLWASMAVVDGDRVVAGRSRHAWLRALRAPRRRATALDALVRTGPDGVEVVQALFDSPPFPGSARRAWALYRLDAVRLALGRIELAPYESRDSTHPALNGPAIWRLAAADALERCARAGTPVAPVLVPAVLDAVGPEAVLLRDAVVDVGAPAIPPLARALRGDRGGLAAQALETLAERRPRLRPAVVVALRRAVAAPETRWPLALVHSLTRVDPNADTVIAERLRDAAAEPNGRDTEYWLEALRAAATLSPASARILDDVYRETSGDVQLLAWLTGVRHHPDEESMRWLIDEVLPGDFRRQRAAVETLQDMGPAARPWAARIEQAMRGAPGWGWIRARVFSRIGGPVAVGVLSAPDSDRATVDWALGLERLRAVDPPAATAVLRAAFAAADLDAKVIGLRAATEWELQLPEMRSAALELSERPESLCRAAALRAMAVLRDDDGALSAVIRRGLTDPDRVVRLVAVLALARTTGEPEPAIGALQDAIAASPPSVAPGLWAGCASGPGAAGPALAPTLRAALLTYGDQAVGRAVDALREAEGRVGARSFLDLVLIGP